MVSFRFVVKMVMRTTNCNDCIDALIANREDLLSSDYAFVSFKTNGGLVYASRSVVEVCKTVEQRFRLMESRGLHLSTKRDFMTKFLTVPTLEELTFQRR